MWVRNIMYCGYSTKYETYLAMRLTRAERGYTASVGEHEGAVKMEAKTIDDLPPR